MPFSLEVQPSGLPPRDSHTQRFHLLHWSYFVTDSEFNCLAKLAKPYPVSGPTYVPHIPNQLHCIQTSAHEVLITIYWARLLLVVTLKPIALFTNHGCLDLSLQHPLQRLFATHALISKETIVSLLRFGVLVPIIALLFGSSLFGVAFSYLNNQEKHWVTRISFW